MTLAEAPWQASLRRLEARTAAMWASRRASLLSLGAVAFAVTLGLALLTAMRLSRSLARPLTEMSRAAGEIAAGNLDHPLTLDSPDELGDLARALNRMASDLRTHEEALRAERADLAAKNAELERFTYTVSHDLKSPLVTIRGFAGLAGTDLAAGNSARVRLDLGRIVAAADKMHRLLDDLLELSRVGRVVHPAEDVPLGELAREAVELVKGRIENRGVAVDISPDLPVVRADRRRLLEVLQNLVENAVKFTGERPGPRVEIAARQDEGRDRVLRPGQRARDRAAVSRAGVRPLREAGPRGGGHGGGARPRAQDRRGPRRSRLGRVGRPRPGGDLLLHPADASRRLTLRRQASSSTSRASASSRLSPWRRRIVATPTGAGYARPARLRGSTYSMTSKSVRQASSYETPARSRM